ncbi:MAG: GGDEF-domain containing protein [Thermoleophilia bacterium]|nr:GGDEF-domain containing protein [Thermoleophilia bacterium]
MDTGRTTDDPRAMSTSPAPAPNDGDEPHPGAAPRLALAEPGTDTSERVVMRRGTYIRVHQIEAPRASSWVRATFALMYAMAFSLAGHQLWGWGGEASATLFNHVFNNAIFIGATSMTAWRAYRFQAERLAWGCIAAALGFYCAGDLAWSILYADTEAPVTPADALYLLYSPLVFMGVVLLVRSRIRRFELDRWIDGLAAALIVATPGVVLVLEPTLRASEGTLLTKAVSVAYPLGDIIVLGAVVGVIALAGWYPGRAWIALALGLTCFVTADAFYSVENLEASYALGAPYEWLWPMAGLLVATAAWLRPVRHGEVHAWGWRAIALPVICQVAPMVMLFLNDQPASEQLLTTAVLAIVLVQLVVSRPRKPAELA